MRVMLFTDTLGDVNGVSRFILSAARRARDTARGLTVVTSTRFRVPDEPNIVNFAPVLAGAMPRYENLELVLPPAARMLRHAAAERPDAVHVSTPGPVGMVGRLAARRLGLPLLGVYHTDFPAYIERLFDDAAFAWITRGAMRRFYRPFARIFTRSAEYRDSLVGLGIERRRLLPLRPGIDTDAFHVRHRDPRIWDRLGGATDGRGVGASRRDGESARAPVRVLSVGRVSVEKNLPLLTRVWRRVDAECRRRGLDADLIVVGDGPYRAAMERDLGGCAARFLGFRHGPELSAIYASADLFVFPSTTDTLGQVVMEAGSSGLPVIVSDEGGPKEVVDHGRTGLVLDAGAPDLWVRSIVDLVADAARRAAMGRAAHHAMQAMTFAASFDHFWEAHAGALRDARDALRRGARHDEPRP